MRHLLLSAALVACIVFCSGHRASGVLPVGGFVVHMNQQNVTGFSDSRRSVTYYAADDIGGGPLFSVHVPGENYDDGDNLAYDGEELSAIATDPMTGDTYILSFDSTSGGSVGDTTTNVGTGVLDTLGTLDLYRIDFQAAYDHWSTTFQGNMAAGMAGVGGPTPYIPAGVPAGAFDDYVTYGVGPVDSMGNFDPSNQSHSNAFVLPGVIQKIGEVKRNNGGNFFDFSFEFIDEDTLLMLDDSSESQTPVDSQTAAGDHAYRILERVSTSPGSADDSSPDFLDGGYNNGTTESWNSRRIGLVNLDFADGEPVGHSEPESTAFYADPLTGVRGIWVTESDSTAETRGDDIAFYEIDPDGNGIGYRPQAVGPGPEYPMSFALDNDPLNDSSANDGQADNIFVDQDTGDIIIIESGFGDDGIASIGAEHEPSIIRREVLSYDDGAGNIRFGAWSEKIISMPNKDTGDVGFLERGQWAAYNSEEDLVYIFNPGAGGETPAFEMDIMVIDVNTGLTTTYNNVDESVSLYPSTSFGDAVDYFYIAGDTASPGDFNGDGLVDAADYTVWRDNLGGDESLLGGNGDGQDGVDQGDYLLWKSLYGTTYSLPTESQAAPEPAAVLLVVSSLSMLPLARRRR